MELKNYSCFFHDGGIINIEQNDNNIKISMESSQILPEWNKDNILLSNFQTIKGKICLEEVKKIVINDQISNSFKMNYDTADILDFHIKNPNKVFLLVI